MDIVDLWEGDHQGEHPAFGMNNSWSCTQTTTPDGANNDSACIYEDQHFVDRVMAAIQPQTNGSAPFFVFWAPRIVHSPLQVPQQQLDHFSFIKDGARKVYHAMVYYIDEAIGNVTRELKSNGQWENTLLVAHADNGGPIYYSGCCGGNNYPLRGGKLSNWYVLPRLTRRPL
jgi:arylsulfatase B